MVSLLLLLGSVAAMGQDTGQDLLSSIALGPLEDGSMISTATHEIGRTDGHVFVHTVLPKSGSGGYHNAVKYNKQMRKVGTVNLAMDGPNGEKLFFMEAMLIDAVLTAVYYNREKEGSVEGAYWLMRWNTKTLKPMGKIQRLAEAMFYDNAWGAPRHAGASVVMSKDSNTIMLASYVELSTDALAASDRYTPLLERYEGSSDRLFGCHLYAFDRNWEQLWDNGIVLPFESKDIAFIEQGMDNLGDLYWLIERKDDRMRPSRTEYGPSWYELLIIREGGTEAQRIAISEPGDRISRVKMLLWPNGQVVCAGYMGMPGKGPGYFTHWIEGPSGKTLHRNFHPFSKEQVLRQLTVFQRKRVDKGKAPGSGDTYVKLDELFAAPNGDCILVGSNFRTNGVVKNYAPVIGSDAACIYAQVKHVDVYALRVRPDGTTAWFATIPRGDGTTQTTKANHRSFMHDEHLYTVYVDHPDNLDLAMEDEFNDFRQFGSNRIGVLAHVDPDGRVRRMPMLRTWPEKAWVDDAFYTSTYPGALTVKLRHAQNDYQLIQLAH